MSRRPLLRALATTAYFPTFLAELGLGAMLPLFALSVVGMDHSEAIAAAAVALYSVGRMGGSAWGGRLSVRVGPSHAAMVSLAALAVGALGCAISPTLVPFLVATILVGFGHAAYHVARQGQIAVIVPPTHRARALTTLAGTWRVANFLGPLGGALLISAWGLSAAYAGAAVTVVAAMVALRLTASWRERGSAETHPSVTFTHVIRENLGVLRTLGVAVVLTGAVRASRIVVIPLWAHHLGVDDHVISLIFAASAAVDMLLFYPAGWVMDRWGRAWTAVPSTLILALGMIALPLMGSVWGVTAVALALGIGNGWGSGVLMTLGADVAPAHGRDMFIGVWMVMQDAGGLAGPALISALAAVALPAGIAAVGGVGILTSAALWRWIPPWPGRAGVRDHGST